MPVAEVRHRCANTHSIYSLYPCRIGHFATMAFPLPLRMFTEPTQIGLDIRQVVVDRGWRKAANLQPCPEFFQRFCDLIVNGFCRRLPHVCILRQKTQSVRLVSASFRAA